MSARPAFANTQPAVWVACQCSTGGECTCGLYQRCPAPQACEQPEMAYPDDPPPMDWSGAWIALGIVGVLLGVLFLGPMAQEFFSHLTASVG